MHGWVGGPQRSGCVDDGGAQKKMVDGRWLAVPERGTRTGCTLLCCVTQSESESALVGMARRLAGDSIPASGVGVMPRRPCGNLPHSDLA